MEPMSHDPNNAETLLQEELVSYLDGELNAEQSRQLEQRVALEPSTRRVLEEFDRTWHLLDELETPTANDDFTHTTLEMVAQAAKDDAAKMKADGLWRLWRIRLLTVTGLVAAMAIGFLLVAGFVSDPNASFMQDLQLLENYRQYHDVDSIEFLRALNKEDLFTKDADGAPLPASSEGTETIAQARKRFETMPADRQEDLFKQEELLNNDRDTAPAERKRIRELHEAIQNASDRDKLVGIMNRYSKWFDEQPAWQRGVIRRKEVPDRIKEIRDLLATNDRFRLDDPKDRQVVAKWMHDHALDARFTTAMSPGPRGRDGGSPQNPQGPGAAPKSPRGGPFGGVWGRVDPSRLRPEDVANLESQLSPETRARLDKKTPDQKAEIFTRWFFENASAINDEALAEYFEKLKPQQQDHLMSLPVEQMYNELFLMAFPDQSWRGDRPGMRGSGGRRGRNPSDMRDIRTGPELEMAKDSAKSASSATKPATSATKL
jgi:hypothetical protein